MAVVEGATEDATLVRRLLADLAERGLDASKGLLFVVDGSKALSSAIPAVSDDKGSVAAVCTRNATSSVTCPKPSTPGCAASRAAPGRRRMPTTPAAIARDSPGALARKHSGAAARLRQGLEETLTVTKLQIDGSLLKTVFSTNPVESMIEIIRDHATHPRETLA